MQQTRILWAKFVHSTHTQTFCFITVMVFFCCLLGLATQSIHSLALFWPVNAILISVFLRFPRYNSPTGWMGAICGYMLAHLSTGSHLVTSSALTLANLTTVTSVLALIHFFKIDYRHYDKGFTFLKVAAVCGTAGLGGALFATAIVPSLPGNLIAEEHQLSAFGLWWSGEIVNCVILIPLMLTFPKWKYLQPQLRNRREIRIHFLKILPLFAIIFSLAVTHLFPGPGTMLYPLAALIWAALTYKLFTISVINLAIFLLTLNSHQQYLSHVLTDPALNNSISIRIGISMLVLAPLIVCVISRNRQRLFKEILYLANHDSLTHTLNRRYFFEAAEHFLQQSPKHPFALLMLDIDYFKKINDNYGHHVGDHVLQHFAHLVSQTMRKKDLFARIGGEEFIVLLANTTELEALDIAERIRYSVANSPLKLVDQDDIYLTVSIGVTLQQDPSAQNLKDYMVIADFALYSAKAHGRNQVMVAA